MILECEVLAVKNFGVIMCGYQPSKLWIIFKQILILQLCYLSKMSTDTSHWSKQTKANNTINQWWVWAKMYWAEPNWIKPSWKGSEPSWAGANHFLSWNRADNMNINKQQIFQFFNSDSSLPFMALFAAGKALLF